MSTKPRFALAFSLLLAATAPAFATEIPAPGDTPPAPVAATASREQKDVLQAPQGKFVQELGDKAISLLANKELPIADKEAQFRQMLSDTFDLPTIARFVIGRSWQTATPEQQKEYMSLFESLVVKTYSDSFALYTGEGFKVRTVVPENDKDSIVNSDITHPDGSAPTTVSWRIRTKGEKMGIIDVVVEGVSMSLTQRQEYASVIQRNGGDIEALLKLMRQRVADKPAEPKKG